MRFAIKALFSRQTSVRLNLSSTLISKVLAAAISLACVPIYIRFLGVAGYGVIGIWTTLETLASLLDFGLSPTVTRELAASSRDPEQAQDTRDLIRSIEIICWTVGVLIGATVALSAPLIATYWLRSSQLSVADLQTCVELIGVLILSRWPLSFYSSGLIGLERQVLLSWLGFTFTLVRSVGAIFVLVFLSPTILAFLAWQIAINMANTGIVAGLLWLNLPRGRRAARFRPKLLGRVWKFAGGVTAIALVSVLLSDLDKLVVSGLVSLEEFGYYTLGSRMAGTLYMAASSVFAALYPALVRLRSQSEAQFAELYHRGSQIMSLLVFPAAITAAAFAKPLIFAWTGNEAIASNTAPIAALLIIGTAFHCTAHLPYAAQLAYGWTSLAFWTNLTYVPITSALLFVLTKQFQGEGAAAVWLLINVSYLATQIPLMHRRILRNEARQWYIQDIGQPLITCGLTAGILAAIIEPAATRTGATVTVAFAGLIVGSVGLVATPLIREQIWDLWNRRRARTVKS
jgi:O-antigen/teichoic acid export membrane protein